jgi:hypothetical protein
MHTSIRADKICQCPNRAARFNAVLSFWTTTCINEKP